MAASTTAAATAMGTPTERAGTRGGAFLMRAAEEPEERFGTGHVTLQVGTGEGTARALAPDHTVVPMPGLRAMAAGQQRCRPLGRSRP